MHNLDLNNDNFTRVMHKKKARGETKVYVSAEERKQLIQALGDAAAILFTYYVEKSGITGYDYADEKAAKALGWHTAKVKRNRLALTKAGWFKQITMKQPTTKQKVTITYLGPEMTSKVLTPEEYTKLRLNQENLCKELHVSSIGDILKDPTLLEKAHVWLDKQV